MSLTIGSLAPLAFGGQYVDFGASDNLAIDQPVVQVEILTQPSSGTPQSLGPTSKNSFLLDSGATTILTDKDVTGELTSNPNFQTVATYFEAGVAGTSATLVSAPYRFDYAGSDGIRQTVAPVQILASPDLQLDSWGGIAGTPVMVGHSTTVDLTSLSQGPSQGPMSVHFSAAPPAGNGHRYDVPLQMINFPLSGQQHPTDPLPTAAPLSMAPVQLRKGTRVTESRFIVDTGAQVSFISSKVAAALGINLATDVVEYLPVGGIGGSVQMPMVNADSLAIHTRSGTDLKWTGLEVGVLDIDPQVAGVFGANFLTNGWLNAFFGGGNGDLSQVHFDFRNAANLTGDLLIDVDPAHDAIGGTNNYAPWDFSGNGTYGEATKWYSSVAPSGAGATANFGNGVVNNVNAPNVTVTVDGAVVVGSLIFSNNQGTGYILGNDGVSGHEITLNNNGRGATVTVDAGVSALQRIQANLVLADNATFDIAADSSLLFTVGAISETGGIRSVTLTGGGTFTIDTPSSYTGGTTINSGTLSTTATGTLGAGPLVINAADSITSAVNLGNNQTVSSLSGTQTGTGMARVSVAAGNTLTINQSSNTSFAGGVVLAASAAANGGGMLVKSGDGTLELAVAPSLGNNSKINVSGGVVRLNVTPASGGSGSVGTGVTATVANQATLELAGSVSALASGAHRVKIVNNSTATAGLLVSGTNQVVANIDGSGTTQVNAGSDLTASHIVESALIIGGTANSKANVTIAASDSAGNSLATTVAGADGLALSGSNQPNDPFAAGLSGSSTLLSTRGAARLPMANSSTTIGSSLGSAGVVPEPSGVLLALIGLLGGGMIARRLGPWPTRPASG